MKTILEYGYYHNTEVEKKIEVQIEQQLATSTGGNCNNGNNWSKQQAGLFGPDKNGTTFSLAVIMKAQSLINLQILLNTLNRWISVSGVVSAILLLAIVYNFNHYVPNISVYNSGTMLPNITTLDYLILGIVVITFISLYILVQRASEIKALYNNRRVDLISHIGTHLCYCKEICHCRDAFLRVMMRQGIDLVFKV